MKSDKWHSHAAYRNSAKLGYFGGSVNIEDTTAVRYNVVYVEEGTAPAAIRNTKIFSTTGSVKIVDRRPGDDWDASILSFMQTLLHMLLLLVDW